MTGHMECPGRWLALLCFWIPTAEIQCAHLVCSSPRVWGSAACPVEQARSAPGLYRETPYLENRLRYLHALISGIRNKVNMQLSVIKCMAGRQHLQLCRNAGLDLMQDRRWLAVLLRCKANLILHGDWEIRPVEESLEHVDWHPFICPVTNSLMHFPVIHRDWSCRRDEKINIGRSFNHRWL